MASHRHVNLKVKGEEKMESFKVVVRAKRTLAYLALTTAVVIGIVFVLSTFSSYAKTSPILETMTTIYQENVSSETREIERKV